MSRTYQVLRNGNSLESIAKEWVFVNKRGAKKFQRMVNKRCRRLDKVAISEGMNDMITDAEETTIFLEEVFDEQHEIDCYEDYYDNELEDRIDLFEDLEDSYDLWEDYDLYHEHDHPAKGESKPI